MINGVSLIFQARDITEPIQRTRGIGIVAAGNTQVGGCLPRDRRPVGKLKEDAVAAANGHFAVALGIPGKTNSRGRVEQVPLEAACLSRRAYRCAGERVRYKAGNKGDPAGAAALNDAVEGITGAGN